jgi:DNA-binding transcriptional LysR family regulator
VSQQPWDIGQARAAAHQASQSQAAAEEFIKDAFKQFAEAEEQYRIALAKRIVELRAEGWAATVCQDLARGDVNVARLRRERDIAEGVKEAAVQASWRRSADRRDVEAFIDWSKRRDLAEGFGRAPDGEVIGGRR